MIIIKKKKAAGRHELRHDFIATSATFTNHSQLSKIPLKNTQDPSLPPSLKKTQLPPISLFSFKPNTKFFCMIYII